MRRTSLLLLCIETLSLILLPARAWAANPADVVGVAVIGDSASDEYRADNNRGGVYGATTLNWVEQLQRYRGWEIGPWGTRATPRRTGYEFNWALSGEDSASMLANGQHTGVALQVTQEKVNFVIIMIGSNDFAPYYDRYAPIYNGTLSGQQLQNKLNKVRDNIFTAVDTVQAANAKYIMLVGVPDWSLSGSVISVYTDPVKRQRMTDAMANLNGMLAAGAASRQIAFLDINSLGKQLLSKLDNQYNLVLIGEKISLLQKGDEPHHIQLSDDHPGTVANGFTANGIIDLANQTWGWDVEKFSDYELLTSAGISVQSPCIADINHDGFVDLADYSILASNFYISPPFTLGSDINNDGIVDLSDYSLLANRFFQAC